MGEFDDATVFGVLAALTERGLPETLMKHDQPAPRRRRRENHDDDNTPSPAEPAVLRRNPK